MQTIFLCHILDKWADQISEITQGLEETLPIPHEQSTIHIYTGPKVGEPGWTFNLKPITPTTHPEMYEMGTVDNLLTELDPYRKLADEIRTLTYELRDTVNTPAVELRETASTPTVSLTINNNTPGTITVDRSVTNDNE